MNDEFPLIKTVYLFLLKKCLFKKIAQQASDLLEWWIFRFTFLKLRRKFINEPKKLHEKDETSRTKYERIWNFDFIIS